MIFGVLLELLVIESEASSTSQVSFNGTKSADTTFCVQGYLLAYTDLACSTSYAVNRQKRFWKLVHMFYDFLNL